MLLNQKEIKNSQRTLAKNSQIIEEKSRWHSLGSDPTRLKIIFLLKIYKELCPTDISQVLDISMSAASHQLGLLEREGLVKRMKMGKMVCYTITPRGRKILLTIK